MMSVIAQKVCVAPVTTTHGDAALRPLVLNCLHTCTKLLPQPTLVKVGALSVSPLSSDPASGERYVFQDPTRYLRWLIHGAD